MVAASESPQKKRRGRPRKNRAPVSTSIHSGPDVEPVERVDNLQSDPALLRIERSMMDASNSFRELNLRVGELVAAMQSQFFHQASPPEPKRVPPAVVRCYLSTVSNSQISELSAKTIAERFREAGEPWSHVKATRRFDTCIQLFLDYSDNKPSIEEKVRDVPRVLKVSGTCQVLKDRYLVATKSSEFSKDEFPALKACTEDWSRANDVKILDASWRFGRLILSIETLEGAQSLVARQVFLEGKNVKTSDESLPTNDKQQSEKSRPYVTSNNLSVKRKDVTPVKRNSKVQKSGDETRNHQELPVSNEDSAATKSSPVLVDDPFCNDSATQSTIHPPSDGSVLAQKSSFPDIGEILSQSHTEQASDEILQCGAATTPSSYNTAPPGSPVRRKFESAPGNKSDIKKYLVQSPDKK
ncbi:MAG: hypothetical protein Q9174_002016 [Haloplaca sp. 1 TL-2023]